MSRHQLNRRSFLYRAAPVVAMALGGTALTGCSNSVGKDEGLRNPEPLPINSFQHQWATRVDSNHGPITRMFLRDALVFGYTDDGTSFVLNRANGTFLHEETIRYGDQVLRPPVVLKDFIVYPTLTTLEVYDKAGALLNSKRLVYAIRSDAVGSKTFVYFGADFVGGSRLVSVDVTSGIDHKWELMFPKSTVSASPAVVGDAVYCGATNGDVVGVTYDTRDPIWPTENNVFHTYGSIQADLVGDETGIYVASNDSKLCCVNRNSGRVKWQYFSNVHLVDAPVVTKDMVYQKVEGVGFVAFDKLNGPYNRMPKWTAPDVSRILAQDEKFAYVLRTDNVIVALDKTNGHALFTSTRHDLMTYATNSKDGTIYCTTTGNRVLAVTPVLKPGVVGELAFEPVAEKIIVAMR